MTDDEMLALDAEPQWQNVRVRGSDYEYDGWLVTVFPKRRKTQLRCVVEDSNGRLFIHNASQLTAIP
jgi:hypothetical protein